jgi:methyl-accepting chemotaxis protein
VNLNQWKLGPKIYLVVALLSAVAIGIGALGADTMRVYNRRVEQLSLASKRAALLEQVNGLIYATVMEGRGVYLSKGAKDAEEFAAGIERDLAGIRQRIGAWAKLADAADTDDVARMRRATEEFSAFREQIVTLARAGDIQGAIDIGFTVPARNTRKVMAEELTRLAGANNVLIDRLTGVTTRLYEDRVIELVVLTLGGVFVCSLLAVLFVRRFITGPINVITRTMTRLAAGDVSGDIAVSDRDDEMGAMARAVRVFQEQAIAANALSERVTENIRRVAIAATQASSAVSQVSDGANIQLGALKQSAAALGQSTAAMSDVARSTQMASEQAREASILVADGLKQMSDMVARVGEIAESSTRVQGIADSIQRIASQTNMLSLNAAIEAARAGEHGRGFAVVAGEVRKLAENSGTLAQEIGGLVKQATQQADAGVEMAREVGGKMEQIAQRVRQSDRLVGAIAAAMEEQQTTVADINHSVTELTRIGQSNATAAEEITATMLDLSRLADHTRIEVDQFRKVAA